MAQDLGFVAGAAKKLGIPTGSLYAWRSKIDKDGADAFPSKGKLVPDEDKQRSLESKNKRLKQEFFRIDVFFSERHDAMQFQSLRSAIKAQIRCSYGRPSSALRTR